jgi:hypothetical protein
MQYFITWLVYCGLTFLVWWAFGMQFRPSFGFGTAILMCVIWGYISLDLYLKGK